MGSAHHAPFHYWQLSSNGCIFLQVEIWKTRYSVIRNEKLEINKVLCNTTSFSIFENYMHMYVSHLPENPGLIPVPNLFHLLKGKKYLLLIVHVPL